ncbi:NUDIX hydrolase [Pseudohalioglobus lutimaris]|uniref:NUDIX domain-containing protein n=1 Tax=Pseudohalioglobus lutimaris TaxID=1737061 RepID=A0A2N5WX92_9GAMM|nr:NUDIX hydrolase [Pseudohalioglobus lutimaris]PLW66847.1 NUDIX domain-containing protein [Pseudohalioglobus lutimaris]
MKFCTSCGNAVALKVPHGDDRERFVCTECEIVHYVNPRVIVGCLPMYGDRVLLCKRAIEPRLGYWTLPAGFMENGETTPQGAARETWEEARARVRGLELYRIFDVPYISQVYMFYRCEVENGQFGVGPESLETGLYQESQIPWDEIAFPVVRETLQEYFEDVKSGHYPVRVSSIEYRHRKHRDKD